MILTRYFLLANSLNSWFSRRNFETCLAGEQSRTMMSPVANQITEPSWGLSLFGGDWRGNQLSAGLMVAMVVNTNSKGKLILDLISSDFSIWMDFHVDLWYDILHLYLECLGFLKKRIACVLDTFWTIHLKSTPRMHSVYLFCQQLFDLFKIL